MIIITGCSSRLFQAQQLKTDFQSHVHISYISLATGTMSLDSPFCFSGLPDVQNKEIKCNDYILILLVHNGGHSHLTSLCYFNV